MSSTLLTDVYTVILRSRWNHFWTELTLGLDTLHVQAPMEWTNIEKTPLQ